jgi:hypothetical protein
MKFTSRGFLAYTFALLICAPSCAVYRTLASYLAPRPAIHAEYVPHRAADRMIAAALPTGWAVRSGLYITLIDDEAGVRRGYAYVRLAAYGHPYLTAGFHAESGPPPAPAVWDLADPESPGRFRAWLAGMIRSRGESEGAK